MFNLTDQQTVNCYTTYFNDQYQICSDYFTNSFDSFLVNKKNFPLILKGSPTSSSTNFMIFDNSLSKKEVLDESDSFVKMKNDIVFSLDGFLDYEGHVESRNPPLISAHTLRNRLHLHVRALPRPVFQAVSPSPKRKEI
jgi:hypothetical protein